MMRKKEPVFVTNAAKYLLFGKPEMDDIFLQELFHIHQDLLIKSIEKKLKEFTIIFLMKKNL